MHAPGPFIHRENRGFTLVEILVVVTIIGILMVLIVPGIHNMIRSTDLSTSAVTGVDALNMARQRALSTNHPVEVRIYKVPKKDSSGPTPPLAYRAIGIYQINETGPKLVQKLLYLTGNAEFSDSETFGTLLSGTNTPASSAKLTVNGSEASYDYHYFDYLPDGSTNLNPHPTSSADTWHVMIYNSVTPPNGTTPPANYISIQLDAISGRTATFQPGM